jgi:hypothetical protein
MEETFDQTVLGDTPAVSRKLPAAMGASVGKGKKGATRADDGKRAAVDFDASQPFALNVFGSSQANELSNFHP